MHETLLLIDENYEYLGHDSKKWTNKINKQIEKYYTDNSFCDWAFVGVDNVIFCKPQKGFINKDNKMKTAPDSTTITINIPVKSKKYGDCYTCKDIKLKNCCHICEIKNLTKINDECVSFIEFTNAKIGTIYACDKKFKQMINKLNNRKIQGVVITLDLHR